jgi:hypothetical protein
MAIIVRLDHETDKVFPVETLRSLLPMLLCGLKSTQLRIRQATYRFLQGTSLLGGIRWVVQKDALALLKAINFAGDEYEAKVYDAHKVSVREIYDYATAIMDYKVESGRRHPCTLVPVAAKGEGSVKWVWYHPADGRELQLGEEEVFTQEEVDKINARFLETVISELMEVADGR